MNKQLLLRIIKWVGITFSLLLLVLVVHIYLVTRIKPPTDKTVAMARIDVKTSINAESADKITAWLYQQKGVNNVLVNTQTDIVIFTFYPTMANANTIASNLSKTFNLPATRHMPSEKELQSGCPVAATSFTYKTYKFIQHFIN